MLNAQSDINYEQAILDTANNIQNNHNSLALQQAKKLTQQFPNSKMAHVFYADLLLAHVQPINSVGNGLFAKQKADLSTELQRRWFHNQKQFYKKKVPSNVLMLANNQPYILIADMNESRVYVFKNQQGMPVYETDFFMTIGLKGYHKRKEGDQRTPLGVYYFTEYIDGKKLPDLYGTGAFPINYPNNWDRKNNRSGSGIWLHGTPSSTYNRAPQASDGCFVISNDDMKRIDPYISYQLSTPVILTENIEWLDIEQWQDEQRKSLELFSHWQQDWESLSHNKYIGHYSSNYSANDRNFKKMSAHKRWVNAKKQYIKIGYSELNIFKYPGEENLKLFKYIQDYQSNNYDSITPKELYWSKDFDAQWRIIFES